MFVLQNPKKVGSQKRFSPDRNRTDRQTERERERQTERQTNRQTDGQTDLELKEATADTHTML